jgi:hypothetical protein
MKLLSQLCLLANESIAQQQPFEFLCDVADHAIVVVVGTGDQQVLYLPQIILAT